MTYLLCKAALVIVLCACLWPVAIYMFLISILVVLDEVDHSVSSSF